MKPIKLECKNFRSYKNLNLSFDNDGVMPIIGDNGAGKSSIFYAILLAIYGKVLKDDSEIPIKDLISTDGSTELLVKLLFSHNLKTYSIERIYKKTVSKSDVEKYDQVKCEFLEIIGDTTILLSNKGKNSTNAKIISILGKDCSNFCNSIFFPQGEEDRLAKLSPAGFVEEISKLKNITIWEQLRKKAVGELENIVSMIDGIEMYIKDSIDEISHKEEISNRIKELDIFIKEKREEISIIESKLSDLSLNKNNINNLLSQIKRIESDIFDYKEDICDIDKDIKTYKDKVSDYNNIIFDKENIIKNKNKQDILQDKKVELEKKMYEKNNLLSSISIIENDVNQAEFNIKRQISELTNRRNSLLLLINDEEQINNRHLYCINYLNSLESLQEEYDQLDIANQQYLIDVTKLNSRNDQLRMLIKEETEKVKKIINTCTCSECERPIDNNGLEQIKSCKTVKIDSYKIEGRNNSIEIERLNNLICQNKQILVELKSKLLQKHNCTIEIGQLQSKLNNINSAKEEVELFNPKILELNNIIENRLYSNKINELISLKERLNSIVYNNNDYEEINKELLLLRDIDVKLHKLKNAEEQLPLLENKLNDLISKLDNRQNKIIELEKELIDYNKNSLINSMEIIQKEENINKNLLENIKREFNILMKDFGSQQTSLDNIIKKEDKIKAKQNEILKLKNEKYLLDIAIEMYSKSGIPTLIIENMLPQIEKEANSLLQLMMSEHSIKFDRPKRADGTYMDKIVIMIRDKRGHKRPFNTFSGAEAFQISFSLRVAICGSEDVMFIDEGFGKLDDKNMGLITKTLGALKSKFNKIILITHVEKLKEMFDIKLKVELDSNNFSNVRWIKD
ncbi:MAG: SMC family ATPase [Methanothrix sp.]|jgi:exonuclease SbcC|nr:SMC family ATPase [Methanothrix sp.]